MAVGNDADSTQRLTLAGVMVALTAAWTSLLDRESRCELHSWNPTRGALLLTCTALFVSSGCAPVIATAGDLPTSGPVTGTVSADALAEKTEQHALERGFDLEVDCGTDDVQLTAGTSVKCSAQYRVEGSTSLLTVTIASVSVADFDLTVVGFGDPLEGSSR